MAKRRIYYAEFRRSLERESLKPLYLFTGAEMFLKEEGILAVLDKALPPADRSMNLESLYADTDVSGLEVKERALTMPFFTSQRVLIVRQVEKWRPADLAAFQGYLENPSPSTTLIFSSQEEKLKSAAWQSLAAKAYHVECYPLFDNQIPDWIVNRSREHGKRIEHDAVGSLIERTGQSLSDLDNELWKLANYIGTRDTISVDDVKIVAGFLRHDTVHDLNEAMGKKALRPALRLAEQLFDAGANAPQVLGAMAWHFRSLYGERRKIEAGSKSEEVLSHIRNFQVRQKRLEQLNAYRSGEFSGIFRELLRLDQYVKTGKPHWETELVLMILRLLGGKMTGPAIPEARRPL